MDDVNKINKNAAFRSLGEEHELRFLNLQKHRKNHVDFDGSQGTLYAKFVEFCDANTKTISQLNHYIRFCQTFKRMYLELPKGAKIGEAGGFSMISKFLVAEGYDCHALPGDLRYEIAAPSDEYDIVFSFETLEHIKDHNSDERKDIVVFNFSGMKSYIAEMARVLRPGGHLFLTTPNPNSLLVMTRLLENKPVFMAAVHVRELTRSEIGDLCSPHFVEKRYETSHCYRVFTNRKPYFDAIESLGAPTSHRGDNQFFHFEKK